MTTKERIADQRFARYAKLLVMSDGQLREELKLYEKCPDVLQNHGIGLIVEIRKTILSGMAEILVISAAPPSAPESEG